MSCLLNFAADIWHFNSRSSYLFTKPSQLILHWLRQFPAWFSEGARIRLHSLTDLTPSIMKAWKRSSRRLDRSLSLNGSEFTFFMASPWKASAWKLQTNSFSRLDAGKNFGTGVKYIRHVRYSKSFLTILEAFRVIRAFGGLSIASRHQNGPQSTQ